VTAPGITSSPTRVIIVDDHPLFLAGLRAMLSAIPNTEVVAEATTGAAAVDAARRLDPDIVLMDLDMPVMNGVEATRRIVNECPGARVLVLTMLEDRDSVYAAMRAGAHGYLLKGTGIEHVMHAFAAVRYGGIVLGPQVAGWMIDCLSGPKPSIVPFPELTDRERAVLELIADGSSNAEIARQLALSIKTVRNYLSRIFAKLQVVDRTQAAVLARREGLGN